MVNGFHVHSLVVLKLTDKEDKTKHSIKTNMVIRNSGDKSGISKCFESDAADDIGLESDPVDVTEIDMNDFSTP
jgi:hypothetical protein